MTEAPIDFVHLAQYTAGDKVLEADLLAEFVINAEGYVARIAAAPGSEDADIAAHTLKGSAQGMGAFALAQAAAEAEEIETADAGNNPEILSRLHAEMDRLRAFVAGQGI